MLRSTAVVSKTVELTLMTTDGPKKCGPSLTVLLGQQGFLTEK